MGRAAAKPLFMRGSRPLLSQPSPGERIGLVVEVVREPGVVARAAALSEVNGFASAADVLSYALLNGRGPGA